jgi:two-component system, LuxR family, response regulator FixJ
MAATAPYVAVVDDEAPVRKALSRLLRLAHYETRSFASGDEFFAALAARRPDCVVLDVNMPGLTGFDVYFRLKAEHIDVPIVFITASDDPAFEQQAWDAGGALLRKPFSNEVLLQAIGEVLAHARQAG